jgi:glycosyltransferase involved in cell wall biosynthesis
MRVLMLSPYPPMLGGISAYADQLAESMRAEGHKVVVASPESSDADRVLDISKFGAGLRLAMLARHFDRLIVQFQPEMLGPPGSPRRTWVSSFLRLAAGMLSAPNCEVCVHEVNYPEGRFAPVLRVLGRRVWGLADLLIVHTERERHDFAAAFNIHEDRIRVVSQGKHLVRRTSVTQATARSELDLPGAPVLLLAIGFLQPNKGFDRAILAFGKLQLQSERVRLYVVGSMWREDPTSVSHVVELRRLADATSGVEMREGYLGDEDFDRWIVAADALVLPYRRGWSSNVMERGLLYDRPVIMARVGGMAEQGVGRANVALVENDHELRDTLRQVVDDLLSRSVRSKDPPRA